MLEKRILDTVQEHFFANYHKQTTIFKMIILTNWPSSIPITSYSDVVFSIVFNSVQDTALATCLYKENKTLPCGFKLCNFFTVTL